MTPLLVHADPRGLISPILSNTPGIASAREQLLEQTFYQLEKFADGNELVLPAFNYDFTKTGEYNVQKDLPQVGSVSSAAVNRAGWIRSATPVYSFVSNKARLKDFKKPFSQDSLFSNLVEEKGKILLFGVNFDRLTFIHFVEHMQNVPYRYEKSFPGKVTDENVTFRAEVTFHVRPKNLSIGYDFSKLGQALLDSKAASIIDSRTILIDASASLQVLGTMLSRDPLAFLEDESRVRVEAKLFEIGQPFEIGHFE